MQVHVLLLSVFKEQDAGPRDTEDLAREPSTVCPGGKISLLPNEISADL